MTQGASEGLAWQINQALHQETMLEYRFYPVRRWRADLALPQHKLLIEIEGGVWIGGRHTRSVGFIKDLEKYNTAAILGWYLLRFTPQQVESGEALQVIEQFITERNKERTG